MTNEYKIEYIQRKNDVMDFLNQSIQVMEALEKKDEADNLRVFYNNVEKNVFSIVVVGEFSAGKSTGAGKKFLCCFCGAVLCR